MPKSSSLRPLTSGKCPCKYLIVSELLPTPPLPTTQTVSRLLDSTVCPLCAYSAIYTVPLVPKCSSRWVRIVSVGAGGPGQHAYGGRCHKLSRKILALRESLYLARSRSISIYSTEEVGAAGCVRPISAPPSMGIQFLLFRKRNQPNLLHAWLQVFWGEYRYI